MTCAWSAVIAGRSKPAAMPTMKITARMPRRCGAPTASTASPTAATTVAALVTMTIRRRSMRSAMWPPNSASARAGMPSTSPSQPSASGSRVRSYTWNATDRREGAQPEVRDAAGDGQRAELAEAPQRDGAARHGIVVGHVRIIG